LSLSKFIAVSASLGQDGEVLYVPRWQTRPPPRARTSSCSSKHVELARLLVTVLPLIPCDNQTSLVLESAFARIALEFMLFYEWYFVCEKKRGFFIF
jgi:hypothetical protein